MMDKLVQEFPEQLLEALEIGRAAQIKPLEKPVKHILVAGMGGSGIGGNFIAELIKENCSLPYIVSKGYSLPAYIGEESLVILSSYSGNTEETLESMEYALKQGARMICIASGGKLIAKAKELGLDYIQVPAGKPSPRACLGYSFVQQLFILNKLGIIDESLIKEVETASALLSKEQDDIKVRAKHLADFMNDKIPVIYTTDRMESVAVRFRQQVNENAKMLCWHHVIPEMNHNELVGWRNHNNDLAVIFFRNRDDYRRNQARMDIMKGIIGEYTNSVIEVYSKGATLLERNMYFVHLGDWISVYLAEMRKVDSMEVKVIDFLKGELAKL